MVKIHFSEKNIKTAEVLPDPLTIFNQDDILELMANEGYNGCDRMIIHAVNLHPDFFDLKTGMAGEILQKFSNYRMKLAIVGDFSAIKSKSLMDFIRESNDRGAVCFVRTAEEAVSRLNQ